ncbi:hypothetical protein AVEN_206996-1 [Araneus ventricosus]|uniref:Uncharacterized protein n=1 Tax=Araneus ventricosus TaxID=182803 RepID=A0A4Y2FVR0_ARAVE|nr:hypothetical protein AVEN_206996-1 [Araneus ventricosus]
MHQWNEPGKKKIVICDCLKGDSWLPSFRKDFINYKVPEQETCAGSLWAAFLLRPENQASGGLHGYFSVMRNIFQGVSHVGGEHICLL